MASFLPLICLLFLSASAYVEECTSAFLPINASEIQDALDIAEHAMDPTHFGDPCSGMSAEEYKAACPLSHCQGNCRPGEYGYMDNRATSAYCAPGTSCTTNTDCLVGFHDVPDGYRGNGSKCYGNGAGVKSCYYLSCTVDSDCTGISSRAFCAMNAPAFCRYDDTRPEGSNCTQRCEATGCSPCLTPNNLCPNTTQADCAAHNWCWCGQ
jgi:hypothetical protein